MHTQDDYECDSVRKRKHATEAIELWLNGRITVHVEVVCGSPERPSCVRRPKPCVALRYVPLCPVFSLPPLQHTNLSSTLSRARGPVHQAGSVSPSLIQEVSNTNSHPFDRPLTPDPCTLRACQHFTSAIVFSRILTVWK
jgi:hypothetical protein